MTKTEATTTNTIKKKKKMCVFSDITVHLNVVLLVFMYLEMLCQIFYRAWMTFL